MSGDDGAVAVLVAVLALVLFGLAALVVDVGALYAERRQLQNGADAGAFALAHQCISGPCPSVDEALAQAIGYAGDNDRVDGNGDAEVCGTEWDACTDPPALPVGVRYVRVTDRTLTGAKDDGTDDLAYLPWKLGDVLRPGYVGTRVKASALVAWGGTRSGAGTLPFIMSACEWLNLRSTGTAPTPPLPLGDPVYPDGVPWQYEDDIQVHGAGDCTFNPSGQTGLEQNVPGDFGWLETGKDTSCVPAVQEDLTVDGSNGVGIAKCVKTWLDLNLGHIVDIPVYYEQPTINGVFKIGGWAPFFLTGYRLPGVAQSAPVSYPGRPAGTTPTCLLPETTNDVQCLTGFLVDMPETDGPLTGPSFGLTTVQLIE